MRQSAYRFGRRSTALLFAFALWSSTAQADDAALLRVERVEAAIAEIHALPPLIADAHPGPIGASSFPDAPDILRRAAAEETTLDAWHTDLAESLAEVPGTAPDTLAPIADRLEQARAELSRIPTSQMDARANEIEERLAGRPDRQAIEELAGAMAAPSLGSEVRLAGLRAEALLDAAYANRPDVATMTAEALRNEADAFIEATRAEPEAFGTNLPPALAAEAEQMRRTAELSFLPPADIATLSAFYGSETGRGKRTALTQAFSERGDADARALAIAFLSELAKRADSNAIDP